MRFCLLVVIAVLFFTAANAKTIRIGLLSENVNDRVTVRVVEGHFHVNTSSETILQLKPDESVRLVKVGDNVRVQVQDKTIGVFARITVVPVKNGSIFSLTQGDAASIPYTGSLEMKVRNNKLSPVNNVELEDYVAAVVESEISNLEHEQMLRVQAILTRTFTLGHLDRHASDGFSLCNGVHCQVYQGRKRNNPQVHHAVRSTRDKVAVGSDNKLLLAAYHSNCGGQTAPSGDAWSQQLPTLVPVVDTFCSNSTHARWTVTVTKNKWENYLRTKGVDCSSETNPCYQVSADTLNRSCCLMAGERSIPAKVIRRDLDLKSAFFTITFEDDKVVFHGRGYGHGVGLCQEGAAAMAQSGFTVDQIIRHYYCDVHIVRYQDLNRKRSTVN